MPLPHLAEPRVLHRDLARAGRARPARARRGRDARTRARARLDGLSSPPRRGGPTPSGPLHPAAARRPLVSSQCPGGRPALCAASKHAGMGPSRTLVVTSLVGGPRREASHRSSACGRTVHYGCGSLGRRSEGDVTSLVVRPRGGLRLPRSENDATGPTSLTRRAIARLDCCQVSAADVGAVAARLLVADDVFEARARAACASCV